MSASASDIDGLGLHDSEIVLDAPPSLRLFAGVGLVLLVAMAVLLAVGEFSRKERINGELGYTSGSAKVYPPVGGIVSKTFVEEGDTVKEGDPLVLISLERASEDGTETRAASAEQIALRRRSLEEQKQRVAQISREEQAALQKKLGELQASASHLEQQIAAQREQAKLSESIVRRYADLVRQNFGSPLQLEQAQQNYYEQVARVHSLEHELAGLANDITSARTELLNLPARARNEAAQIDRSIAELDQQSTENEERRTVLVTATQAGTVAAMQAEPGQSMSPSIPLLTILPHDAKLEAVFYVPSRSIGFITAGKPVLLRYQAYPYQKFGQYGGVVSEVTRTPLTPREAQVLTPEHETLYRVTVALDSQTASAYGSPVELRDGMRVDADVVLETRKLYEWILEPVFNLRGKLAT
jgi:membrane fusion protein